MHQTHQIILGAALLIASLAPAGAQVKTGQSNSSGPFSSDWARPTGQTGGYFYNDPRTQQQRAGNPNQQPQPGYRTTCPTGTTYSSGRCR